MKVLILSCNTGEGHNSAAKAVAAALTACGDHCDTADALAFLSSGFSDFISNWHVRLYRRSPFLFNTGYKIMTRRQDGKERETMLSRILSTGYDDLAEAVTKGGYDVVICTHPFSAYMYSGTAKKHTLKPKTAFVATDYTCAPTVDKSKMDTYFIPHESLKSCFVNCFIPEHKLSPSGIPIRAEFYNKVDKAEAKRMLGIPEDKRNVLLACGSMGCGPLKEITGELAKKLPSDTYLTVICGNNDKLKRKLDRMELPLNVRILGFTNNVSLYMDSAEFMITKPGGLTCSEALAKELPLLLVNAVGGCESPNLRFFTENGMAVETKDDVAELAVKLLKSPKKLSSMALVMKKYSPGKATDNICRFLHKEDN